MTPEQRKTLADMLSLENSRMEMEVDRAKVDALRAALRAPAVTGENEHEYQLIKAAVGRRGVTDCSTPLFVQVKNLVDRWDKTAAPPAAGAPPAPGWPDGNNAVRWEANRDVQPVLSAVPNHAEGAQETQGLPRGDSDGSHSPVVGAPPALVALVQRWQKARLALRDAEDHIAYGMAEQVWEIHERALLAWSPAPAPPAPPVAAPAVESEQDEACLTCGMPRSMSKEPEAHQWPSTSQANVCPGCGSVDRSFKRIRNRKVCRDVWHDSVPAPPVRHATSCRAYNNYQPPYQDCTCAPPAVAGGDAPEKADDVCECGHTRSAHAWNSMYFRCYHGRCQCHMFRRRQEGQ